ncbi:MAG: heme lyase CcmF/NrfE family subunit [Methylococcales bacterium]
MIPELGHFALILAFSLALIQATLPIIGAFKQIPGWIAVACPAARGQLFFSGVAFGCLAWSFIVNDFSVAYVANNSNSALPLVYRVSAVWGAHEGSLLLWALVLAFWTGAVTLFSKAIPEDMVARVLGVMGLVSVGFLLFMLLTSNPFERMIPVPLDGQDLNPLLQDPGLAIHPPMLYMGYVGFSVVFAFAIASMLSGQLDTAWARWSRPWTNVAWIFLTCGIALGSWWAYYELGWGGWWFWDPVENASFMPWLVGTALIHSLAVTEKRGSFKAWTVLLAIFAFSLSLLGTFLVRSGVLTSVHAFATDPARGLFILVFLSIVIGGSLLLYSIRAPHIRSTGQFELVSKDSALLINNVLLVVAATSVFLGTLYPLFIDALGMGKISVGLPYFNSVFVPLTAPLAVLVGFAALIRWKKDSLLRLCNETKILFAVSLVLGIAIPTLLMPDFSLKAAIGMVLAVWVAGSVVYGVVQRASGQGSRWLRLKSVPRAFYGMSLAHLGVAVFITGITLTSNYSVENDVRIEPGEEIELSGYRFRLDEMRKFTGPNFVADEGVVSVSRNGERVALLKPQKRIYRVQRSPMTEAAIDAGLFRDLFVALGEPLGKQGAWSVRIYHKPFIRWIWLGAIFMALGGLVAATDKRYRMARVPKAVEVGANKAGLRAEAVG